MNASRLLAAPVAAALAFLAPAGSVWVAYTGRRRIAARVRVAFALLLAPMLCMAGAQPGHVTELHVRAADGLIYFELDGAASGKPACATHSYWIIRDENSTTGKQQLAVLLTAQATGRSVEIYGMGTCQRWSDGEDVNEVILKPN